MLLFQQRRKTADPATWGVQIKLDILPAENQGTNTARPWIVPLRSCFIASAASPS